MREISKTDMNRLCFCCKIPLGIKRDEENEHVVYFDNQFYHRQCFMKMGMIKLKCYHCKEDILLEAVEDDFIYYDKHYYHKDCFIPWCKAKNSQKRKMALLNYDIFLQEAKKVSQELFLKKKFSINEIDKYHDDAKIAIKEWFDRSDVDLFIKEKYDVQDVPYKTLLQIYNGSGGCKVKIPACDLLDMWERKWNYLQKQNQKLIQKNSDIDINNLIKYDLVILMNKYNGYLKWKREQEILAAENKKQPEIQKTDIITRQIIHAKQEDNSDDDFNNLVDDIFD